MENNLIFVTAQPDVPYFHWQVRVYVHNFIENGIDPNNIHVIFAMVMGNSKPSEESLKLKDLGINIHHYLDNRDKKHYIPSIKPFLISKWLKEFPNYGKLFFLHDADIIFREIPIFDSLIKDNTIYLSDTIGYIGYNYIIDCCNRYEKTHKNSEKEQLLNEMCSIVGIDKEIVKINQNNSGGGQYLFKETDCDFWDKIYRDSTLLYDKMIDYHKRFPISPGEIQFWTAEMWSLLWNLWLYKYETKISNELDFSWATDGIEMYSKKKILHMAGVTENLKNKKFYKGDYININPIERIKENFNYFDYIDKNSITIKYIDVMKSLVKNND
jgi:hypothetical protein